MSFVVRMSGNDLNEAYNAVRDGDPSTEWAIFTYENGSSDLVVQEAGAGLEELCTKFSDDRQFSLLVPPLMLFDLPPRKQSDITPSAIMKRVVGHGTAGELPASGSNSYRRSTTAQDSGSSHLQRSNTIGWAPVGRLDNERTRKNSGAPVPIKASAPTYAPVIMEEPKPMSNPFSDPPSDSTALRPTPNRGMTWTERQAAKKRQDTIDEDRANLAIFENAARLGEVGNPTTLTWSQRRALKEKREEEERRRKEEEDELARNEAALKALEEKVRKEEEALKAEMARQEEEERRRLDDIKRRDDEERRRRDEDRKRLDAERRQRLELERQIQQEREEREHRLEKEHQAELARKEEERLRQAEIDRLARKIRDMEEAYAAAASEGEAARRKAAALEAEAQERLRFMEERARRAEEDRVAALKRQEEEELARQQEEEETRLAAMELKARLEREERERMLEEEEREASKREEERQRAAEVQRLAQRVRELELRRDAALIEERTAKMRQEQEKAKRLEYELMVKREKEERERLLEAERETALLREEEDRMRAAEIERLSQKVREMELRARQEETAKMELSLKEREAAMRLRELEERASRLESEKATLLRLQRDEAARSERERLDREKAERERAAMEDAERRLDEDRKLAASPESMTAVEAVAEDTPEKKRRSLLHRKATGWTPLQSNGGFSFERAARSLVRGMTLDGTRETRLGSRGSPPRSDVTAASTRGELSSFLLVDHNGNPQNELYIQLPNNL
ncbi:hypothetical protein FRB99_005555 [Tulasnella sp. 403]|nr:hypothetical protein FRB99_005555 [Tulasnella sp. 403]